MKAAEIIAICSIMLSAGIGAGFFWGLRQGERLGRDREWMDSFFRSIKRDRDRRDKQGRFKNERRTR